MLDSMFASRDTDSVVWRKRSSLNLSLSHAAQTGGDGTVQCHAMQHDLRLSIGQDILEPRHRRSRSRSQIETRSIRVCCVKSWCAANLLGPQGKRSLHLSLALALVVGKLRL